MVIREWFRGALSSSDIVRSKQFWYVCLVAGILFVVVFLNAPLAYFSDAGHDDAWFVNKAMSIAAGHWFGPYNQFALMKGPGYPLFLLAVSMTGIPVALAEATLMVLALWILCLTLARVTNAYRACAVIFAVTLWHPIFLTVRLLRDAIYPAQVFILLALAIDVLVLADSRKRTIFSSILFGAVFAWYWLTREEGVWILPGLAILLAGAIVLAWRDRVRLRNFGIATAIALTTAWALIGAFGLANKAVYGSYTLVDFKGASFNDALDALYSVQVGEATKYLPVPKRVRLEVYKVSPHFAELRDYLDGSKPNAYAAEGCKFYAQTCGDIAGGWFFWAVRTAAFDAGKFTSPANASEFFSAVSAEVRAACAMGALTCRSAQLPGFPPLSAGQIAGLFPLMWTAAKSVLMTDAGDRVLGMRGNPMSSGDQALVDRAALFLNASNFAPLRSAPDQQYVISGWYMDPEHGWIQLLARRGTDAPDEIAVRRHDSPDLIGAFGDPAAGRQRFRISMRCDDSCTVEVRNAKATSGPLKLKDMRAGAPIAVGAGEFFIDAVGALGADDSGWQDTRPAVARKVRIAAAQPYILLGPWVLACAFMAFLAIVCLPWWRRILLDEGRPVLLLALVMWALAGTRMLLLALIEVSLFPAIDPLYMMPAYYLAWLAAGLSFILLGRVLRTQYRVRVELPQTQAATEGSHRRLDAPTDPVGPLAS
jgi:hypothetical protein